MLLYQSSICKALATILVIGLIGLASSSKVTITYTFTYDIPDNSGVITPKKSTPTTTEIASTPTEIPPTGIIPSWTDISSAGKPKPTAETPPTILPPSRTTPPPTGQPDVPNMCRDPTKVKVDAMFNSADGQTYAFVGAYYYKFTDSTIAIGYPKLISETWPDLPNDIDAAFSYRNGKSYFFKGTKYWQYSGFQLDDDYTYPKDISDYFTGIPDNLDAAMLWGGGVFFFKESEFWYFDPMEVPHVHPMYPQPIKKWEGVPDNLSAALEYAEGGQTYFFKDHEFYRFNNAKLQIDDGQPSYPRSTAEFWFDCGPARYIV